MKLSQIKNGKTFKIGDTEFIKFGEENGNVTAVTRDIIFSSDFGGSNKFSESKILKRLETEWLPKIAEIIGEENIVEFETNLLALDGSSNDTMRSKVSLVTLDFYRHNRETFDDYPVESWWWLATPNCGDEWVLCVSPSGCIGDYYCNGNNFGVRPFCIFDSNISVSR